MEITNEQLTQSIALFKWINPSVQPAIQQWSKGREIELNFIYSYCIKKKCQAVWMDFEHLTEQKIKRILKKIDIIPHEFFLYHYQNHVRIGWRIKN